MDRAKYVHRDLPHAPQDDDGMSALGFAVIIIAIGICFGTIASCQGLAKKWEYEGKATLERSTSQQ